MLQRRSGDQWIGKYYFRGRAGLLLYATSYELDAEPDALAVLEALPERFGDETRTTLLSVANTYEYIADSVERDVGRGRLPDPTGKPRA